MNTPNKAVEANAPAQNADKATGASDNKIATPEKKVEVATPAPASVK